MSESNHQETYYQKLNNMFWNYRDFKHQASPKAFALTLIDISQSVEFKKANSDLLNAITEWTANNGYVLSN